MAGRHSGYLAGSDALPQLEIVLEVTVRYLPTFGVA